MRTYVLYGTRGKVRKGISYPCAYRLIIFCHVDYDCSTASKLYIVFSIIYISFSVMFRHTYTDYKQYIQILNTYTYAHTHKHTHTHTHADIHTS